VSGRKNDVRGRKNAAFANVYAVPATKNDASRRMNAVSAERDGVPVA